MNYRRVFFIAFIAFIALFLFRNLQMDKTIDEPIQTLSKSMVMESILAESELNQNGSTIYFPLDYEGKARGVFYVSVENVNGPISYKYRIEEIESEAVKMLEYSLDQSWEGVRLPVGKFDAFRLEGGQWLEI